MAENEIEISKERIDGLSAKLDGLSDQLGEDEKTLLLAVFALAHNAISALAADESEVEGFAMAAGQPTRLPSVGEGFASSFTPGGPSGVGDRGHKPVKVKPIVGEDGIGVRVRF